MKNLLSMLALLLVPMLSFGQIINIADWNRDRTPDMSYPEAGANVSKCNGATDTTTFPGRYANFTNNAGHTSSSPCILFSFAPTGTYDLTGVIVSFTKAPISLNPTREGPKKYAVAYSTDGGSTFTVQCTNGSFGTNEIALASCPLPNIRVDSLSDIHFRVYFYEATGATLTYSYAELGAFNNDYVFRIQGTEIEPPPITENVPLPAWALVALLGVLGVVGSAARRKVR